MELIRTHMFTVSRYRQGAEKQYSYVLRTRSIASVAYRSNCSWSSGTWQLDLRDRVNIQLYA